MMQQSLECLTNHPSVEEFISAHRKWDRARKIWHRLMKHTESRFSKSLTVAFWKKYPRLKKKKIGYDGANTIDTLLYKEIRKPFQDKANKLQSQWNKYLEELQDTVELLGNNAVIIPDDIIWSKYKTVSSYMYSTQTNPAYYAQQSARIQAEEIESLGLKTHIVYIHIPDPQHTSWSVPNADYEIWVNATPETAACLEYKPKGDIVNYVAACWKKGINPRVMLPMLPHGFEEKHGINYYGEVNV